MTHLTPLELAIMKSLWQRRRARVRDVQVDLDATRPLAYTTVMTVLDRLFKKGVVTREKRSRAHVYEAVFSEAEVRAQAVRSLVEGYFDGSHKALVAYLEHDRREFHGPGPIIDGEEPHDTNALEHPIEDSLL